MRSVMSVTIETDDKHPSWRELDNRNSAIRELADNNFGKFMWSGQDKGTLDFAFEIHNEKAARATIAKTMFKHFPGWKYSIETTPTELTNTFRMHAPGPRRRDLRMGRFNGQRGMGM